MKHVEKLAEAYYQERPEGFAEPRADFEAGYRAALEDAAIRGRLAQLEGKVVDIEILALADQEDTDG